MVGEFLQSKREQTYYIRRREETADFTTVFNDFGLFQDCIIDVVSNLMDRITGHLQVEQERFANRPVVEKPAFWRQDVCRAMSGPSSSP